MSISLNWWPNFYVAVWWNMNLCIYIYRYNYIILYKYILHIACMKPDNHPEIDVP